MTATVPGFVASATLAGSLQAVLVDLVELHLQAKQAHWNVVGRNFRDLHLQLDEIADVVREAGDTVAERLRALHATADGRSATVAAATALAAFPAGEQDTSRVVDLVVDRVSAAVTTVRRLHDGIDAEDPTSADILHAITEDLEKQAWLLAAENTVTEGA